MSDDDDLVEDGENQVALGSVHFNGMCHGCGLVGHKKQDCPKEKLSSKGHDYPKMGKRFKGTTCNNCNKVVGHKEADCWEKDEVNAKRPSSWKTDKKDDKEVNASNTKVIVGVMIYEDGDDVTFIDS